jgi:uncharacterized protein
MCQNSQNHEELSCLLEDSELAELITPEDRKLDEGIRLANEKKFKEAIDCLTEVYQQRDNLVARSDAAVCLSDLYAEGLGAPQDHKRSRQLLEEALAQGTDFERWAEACLSLGFYCEQGWGGSQNLARAKQFYEMATWEEGSVASASAAFHLGMLYYKGNGVAQNNFLALSYFKNAFLSVEDEKNQASVAAANALSEIYFNGSAGPKDPMTGQMYAEYTLESKQARPLFKAQAAELLGVFYYAQEEFKEARGYFEDACEYRELDASFSGHVNYFLGVIYYAGQGCRRAPKKALPLLEQLATSSHDRWTLAAFHLGVMNYFGFGVPVNYEIAADYFQQVGTNTHVSVMHAAACAFLGTMAYEGQGMEKSEARAQRYLYEAHFERYNFQEPDLQITEVQKLLAKAMQRSGIVQ